MAKVKNLSKNQLNKLHKGILAAIGSRTNIEQPMAVNEVKKKVPFPSDGRNKTINSGKGLDYVYGKRPLNSQADYPEGLNPFDSSLQKRKLSTRESEWLNYLKGIIVAANSPQEMKEVVDKAIVTGMKMNGCYEEGWSFAEYVVLGMHLHKFKQADHEEVISQLMLNGAKFHDTLLQNKLISEACNKLQREIQPYVDERLEGRRKAGENAVQVGGGSVIDVEIDNKTSLIEFSPDSTVEVAKALVGTDPNKGLGSHIMKMGDGEVEIKNEEGGKRNYVDILGGFEIGFPTSIGRLRIAVYNDVSQVQVRVLDREMLLALQTKGEEIGKDCLFGGMKIEEAVKRGSFSRSGFLSERNTESELLSSSSWVDRVSRGSEETFKAR